MLASIGTGALLAAAALAVAGGLLRGFAGFGSGMLMAPILTLLLAPTLAVPLVLILSLAGSARLLPEVWRELAPRRVLALALPAMLTIPLGARLLLIVDATTIQKAISALVLVLVALLASGGRYEGEQRPRVLIPTGLLSGALTGVGGVGGPPVVLVALSEDGPPAAARANLIAFFALSQAAAVVTYALSGMMTRQLGHLALILVPIFVGAIHGGARLFRRSDPATYRRVALLFLAIIAVIGLLG